MYIFAVALQDGRWHHVDSYAPRRAGRADTVRLWHKIETTRGSGVDAPLSLDRSERAGVRRTRRDLDAGRQPDRRRDGGRQRASARREAVRPRRLHPQVPELTDGVISTREANRFLEAAQDVARAAGGRTAHVERGAACRRLRSASRDILSKRLSREREVGRGLRTHPSTLPLCGRGTSTRSKLMSDTAALPNRAKKGVGLSGVTAGNTALCTVGRTGNDLHYRGYDILDVAETCEFEEIAYLLVHGTLPTRAELAGYKAKLRVAARPAACGEADAGGVAGGVASDGRDAHRRLRAGLRAAGEGRPEPAGRARHRRSADGVASVRCCSTGSTTRTTASASTWRPTTTPSAGTSCICCTASRRQRDVRARDAHLADPLRRARVQRLDLHLPRRRRHRRRHVFGDHRGHRRAARAEAWRRQRGLVRNPEAATRLPTKPRPTSASASPTAR